ncbi:MAG TPA: hypothetical protein VEF34_19710, partial [Syntrophobacteraceae bacterium]|nr:hypothetical protein [Syntrophobacteraceae bacterium]
MAPDSSLHGHHAAGSRAAFCRYFAMVAALSALSLSIFLSAAKAGAEGADGLGTLAAICLPGNSPKIDISAMPLVEPAPPDALKGTPAVLWRNGIQIPIHEPLVERYIRFYKGEGRRTFSEAMKKAKACLPLMIEILESRGVPAEMVSIVVVESGFEKDSSYRGAGGYWQMMAATARNMGLRVDRWV